LENCDPERDKDLSNHVGMARYGNDRLERRGGVSLRSSPENIASTFDWLTDERKQACRHHGRDVRRPGGQAL
jgi:hypothetical protein